MSTKLSKEFDIQDYLINTEKDSKAFFKTLYEAFRPEGSPKSETIFRISEALKLSTIPDRV